MPSGEFPSNTVNLVKTVFLLLCDFNLEDNAAVWLHFVLCCCKHLSRFLVGVEANDGNNTGSGKLAHLAASSRT